MERDENSAGAFHGGGPTAIDEIGAGSGARERTHGASAAAGPGANIMVEPARLRRIIAESLDGILRYLGRLGVPASEVDDVAQEALLVASSKLGGVPPESERAFLYATAARVALNARRANVRRRRAYDRYLLAPPEPPPSQEELTDHLRARARVDAALADMSADLRHVFVLCEIEGLAVAEVARRFALPIGTATSRLRRAREAFFEHVSPRAARDLRARGAIRGDDTGGPEILSWWVSDGEVDALRALLDIHRRFHPGSRVVHGGIRDTTTAKGRLRDRIAGGSPPDTFQANGGQDLLRWTRGDRAASPSGFLEPLEFLFEEEQWRKVFPADVLERVSYAGEAYAVPLNIHRTNTLFYDLQALGRAGIEPPRTLDDLHRACAALKRRGATPLSIGARQPWMLSLLAFENILVALAGPAFYRDFFEGKRSPRAPEVRETLCELARLLDACNDDAGRIGWDEAADRVRIGAAAMTIMGDWAKGYLERRGCLEGSDFAMAPSPGTDGAFVFTMDTFAVPRGARHREAAIDLLRVFGSPHGQSVFSRIKGSRPARSDVLASGDDDPPPAPRDEGAGARVPTLTSLVPPSFSSALDAALADFARTRDAGGVVAVLDREYPTLGGA